jgi:hypothetical protein
MMRCHKVLQLLVPSKCLMTCQSLLNRRDRYLNEDCLMKKKMRARLTDSEVRKKISYHTRPVYVGMPHIPLIDKWYSHDYFKPENQVKDLYACASEQPDTSKLHKSFRKYPSVDDINWIEDCPKKYKRGKCFIPNRVM